ncbi:hypothetical protein K1T71_011515 [Dendrolimus kikuchii]|uniref:Uncharacterized protein n=1 Tax=Dendrolimus kikuchii TaxID=765133 RepID=A0ACC1CP07_9NEOP|nr:hypothetical protein K1T71_011515 [Dendrolimus kikuchii]
MEELKNENEGGSDERNEEENYMKIKLEEEDRLGTNQEENPDKTDGKSATPTGNNTSLKDSLARKFQIITEKIDIGIAPLRSIKKVVGKIVSRATSS